MKIFLQNNLPIIKRALSQNSWCVGFATFCLVAVAGCVPPRVPYDPKQAIPVDIVQEVIPPPPQKVEEEKRYPWEDPPYNFTGPMPENDMLSEGSLWSSNASWGDLLKDQRASFRGDIVQVTGLGSLVQNIPNPQGDNPFSPSKDIEAVQKATREIIARVVEVLPNGIFAIAGEKVEYKEGNRIRYLTRFKGFIRQQDISKQNEVDAKKVFQPEFYTTKAYHVDKLPYGYDATGFVDFPVQGSLLPANANNGSFLLDDRTANRRDASGARLAPLPTQP